MYEKGIIGNLADFNVGYDVRDLEQRGGIFPSDIDLGFDLDGMFLCIMESKKKGVPIKKGQRLYFETLINAWNKLNKKCDPRYIGVCISFEHDTPQGEYIHTSIQKVTKIYDSITTMWYVPKFPITVKEVIQKYKEIYFQALGKTEAEYNIEFYQKKKQEEIEKKKHISEVYKQSKLKNKSK
jgi:hypothetical protein